MDNENRGYHRIQTECPAIYRIFDPQKNPEKRRNRTGLGYPSPMSAFEGMETAFRQSEHFDPFLLDLYLRLDWRLNYLMKILTQKEDLETYPCRAVILDLSASGMKIFGTDAPQAGLKLEFQFVLPILPFRELNLFGLVIRSVPVELPGEPDLKHEMGIEFDGLKEADREHLIQFVVKRDLQLRQGKGRSA